MSQIRVKGKGAGLDACQRVVRAFRRAQPEQTVGDGDLFASNSVFVIVIIVIIVIIVRYSDYSEI